MRLATRAIFISRSSRGAFHGLGVGPPIFVPAEVNRYEDVSEVVSQLKPLNSRLLTNHEFGFTPSSLENRMLALGYFLGVMVGDMSKYPIQRKNYATMRVKLQLSKWYRSNLTFGNYVAHCAGILGIRMKRIADYTRPVERLYDAYRWDSQNSELLLWFFETCLGMSFNQNTTNDPVHADWLKTAPFGFQRSFLQGLSDSDGYVDVNKHEVRIIVDPNELLIGSMPRSVEVLFRPAIVKTQATIMLSVKEAYNLPYLQSNRSNPQV